MIELNISFALVLEDDIVLREEFPRVLKMAEDFLDKTKSQVVLLSGWNRGIGNIVREKEGVYAVDNMVCTDAYLITQGAARIILQANFPVITVADRWKRWHDRYELEIYRTFPYVATQDLDRFGTDIGERDRRQRSLKLVRGVVHKINRAVGVCVDWMLWRMTGR